MALITEAAVAPRRRMLAGVTKYIREHEPWAVYLKPAGADKSLREWLETWQGDGVIAAAFHAEVEGLYDLSIPTVDIVGSLGHDVAPLVHANDVSIGRAGAEHLLERGFRRFGFIEIDEPEATWSHERRQGFVEAVAQRGYDCEVYGMPRPVGQGGPQLWEQQQQALAAWIQALPKPVGVMTSTDLMGQQFLEACLRAGVIVPEQVAVIGADNDELICGIASPPLSSVIINDEQRGYAAAALLDRLMNGEPPPEKPVFIEPSGTAERGSTDILAIDDQAVVRALRYIRDHACAKIGVDEVVAQVPLSRSVLERRIKKVLGRTINEEIVRLRLNTAVELICETELDLKNIAYKAGFRSQSYMNAVFRRKLGRTPGSYREV